MSSIIGRIVRRGSWELKQVVRSIYLLFNGVYYSFFAAKVECNICGFKGERFVSDNWHLNCTCPKCYSHVRHRLLWASFYLIEQYQFCQIIHDKSVLHFAPEKAAAKKLIRVCKNYKTADFFAEGYVYEHIDFNLDMSNMKVIKNEDFDCVIACDVLEHIPNHLEALKETYRILKKGGYGIFTVPQPDNWKTTIEDLSIMSPKERERRFAQFDHLRLYGSDFVDLLTSCGFETTIVDASNLESHIVKKHVLYPPLKSKHELATNNRKIYFAKKP